jgi:flagellar FliJ protein
MPKQFQFRLDTLLKLREAKKKDAQRLLGKLMGEMRLLQDRSASLGQLQNETFRQRSVGQGEAVNVEKWRSIERFLVSIERKIEETNLEIAQLQPRVENARQALVKAHAEHLTLQRLKERRKEQYDFEISKEEQRQADELAVMRYQFNSPKAS